MNQYSQVQYIKRKDYYDVIIYYSKNGQKFRPPADVKVLHRHLTKTGAISSTHPNFDEDTRKIKEMHDRLENLVKSYKEKYGEKPPVSWLEKEFARPQVDAQKDLQDLLCYWPQFIKDKAENVRSEKTIGRINNVKHTLEKFRQVKNYAISFSQLDQAFFNDLAYYMIKEHEHFRNKKQDDPETGIIPLIGLNNDTAIKRLKDFTDYLKYCVVEKDVDIKLEKIKKYIKTAKHKHEIRPLSKTQKWELTLTSDEIQFVVNLDHYEPEFWASLSRNQKRYLDIMLFMCLQGTAPVDTQDISKTDIRHGKIIKDRSKSGQEFKVELDPVAAQSGNEGHGLPVPIRHLGVEPLAGELTGDNLAHLAAGRTAPLKSFLLDQRRIAGIGNIYADEALHRAELHPLSPAGSMRSEHCEALVEGIVEALEVGLAHGGSSIDDYRDAWGEKGSMQDEFLVHTREGQDCGRCGGTIRRIVVGGRSTYFCPGCQVRLRRRRRRAR